MKAKKVATVLIFSLVIVGWGWVMTNAAFLPDDQIGDREKVASIILTVLSAVGITTFMYLILTWLWKE